MPTSDQINALIDAVARGESCKGEAGAGTGKTTAAIEATKNAPRVSTLYLVFNRENWREARQRFPDWVHVNTPHRMAYRKVVGEGRLGQKSLVGGIWHLRPATRQLCGRDIGVLAHRTGRDRTEITTWILETLATFLNQAGRQPQARSHVPEGAWQAFKNGGTADATALEAVAGAANRLWRAMRDPVTNVPLLHDGYFKLWALAQPRLPYRRIIVDEAQDLSPVMREVVLGSRHAQKVWLGDRCQSIYQFRGAVNVLEAIDGPTYPLTVSWRFGPEIARIANIILDATEAPIRLEGGGPDPDQVHTRQAPPRREREWVLARSNVGATEEALSAMEAGRSVALLGGSETTAGLLRGVHELHRGQATNHPELAPFDSWQDLADFAKSEAGAVLRPMVRMVRQRKGEIPGICRRLEEKTATVRDAEVIVGTAHRAKGLEADTLRIAGDFQPFADHQKGLIQQEANLAYVALTRARKELDLTRYAGTLVDAVTHAAPGHR